MVVWVDGNAVFDSRAHSFHACFVKSQIDFAFVIIFTFEAVMKLVVYGVWFESDEAYLQSPWNVLDFFLVCTSWASLAGGGDGIAQIPRSNATSQSRTQLVMYIIKAAVLLRQKYSCQTQTFRL